MITDKLLTLQRKKVFETEVEKFGCLQPLKKMLKLLILNPVMRKEMTVKRFGIIPLRDNACFLFITLIKNSH